MDSFYTITPKLADLLKHVATGQIQLPDFQRGWVWDDLRIKGLLASIAKSFPIGAIMLLENGNPNVRFKPKPIEGAVVDINVTPNYYVLDGQQRITSLFQAISTNKPVVTRNEKNKPIRRWYYIDMQKALDTSYDLEEAIISVNEHKQVTQDIGRQIVLDLSTPEKEFEQLMFPVCMLDEHSAWRLDYDTYWHNKGDNSKHLFYNEFERNIINNMINYTLLEIILVRDNTKEAVCQVFEKVNTGGIPLNVFELLTATYAADDYDLKQNWESLKREFSPYKLLANVQNTDIIQSVTLLSRYRKRIKAERDGVSLDNYPSIGCKRKDMLDLTLEDFKSNIGDIKNGYIEAAKLLTQNCIFSSEYLPYKTQLIPLAAIIAELGPDHGISSHKTKIMRWYWCGVFGELYGGTNESRYALDLPQVVNWVKNRGTEPSTIYDSNFNPSRLLTLRTRLSAAYKGVYTLLIKEGLTDWITNTQITLMNYFDEKIEIHHIFPEAWCKSQNISPNIYNSVINKTPLSQGTNKFVLGQAPSEYILRLEKHTSQSQEQINEILVKHLINPELMRENSFDLFFRDRTERLLQMLSSAMGKEISRDIVLQDDDFEPEDYVDEEIDVT